MFPVPAAPFLHLLFETLGVLLGLALYRRLRATTPDTIRDGARFILLIAATFGALVGSRLVGALENPALFWSGGGEWGWLYYFRSKTIVGGLLGGLFAVEGAKRLLGVRQRSGDLYVFPLLLAMILGRIGCFLMGVGEPTFGLATDLPWGIDLGDGISRHPTALYEIVLLLFVSWAGTQVQAKSELKEGRLFMLFLTTYLIYRFLVGFIQPRELYAGLGAIQWACLLGLCWYAVDEMLSSDRLALLTSRHAER